MTAASTYRLVLPRPWARIPIRTGTEERVRELVAELMTKVPKDAPPDQVGPWRRELERRLVADAKRAAEYGGVDLYIPVDTWNGFLTGASFIVSEILRPGTVPAEFGPDSAVAAVVAELVSSSEGARVFTIDETAWVRRDRVVPAGDPSREGQVDYASRRVEYLAAVPGDPERWVVSGFSCVGAGDPEDDLANLTVELFDAIMSTWRWNIAPDENAAAVAAYSPGAIL